MSVQPEKPTATEREWRDAVMEVENLRQEYERNLAAEEHDMDEPAIGRLWLRLWLAERRRDELLKRTE